MKVVGNCPQCGNPIYGEPATQSVNRTCFCNLRPAPITVTPQPYYPPIMYPLPYWWSNANDPASTIQTFTTGNATFIPPPQPPDEDAGLVT